MPEVNHPFEAPPRPVPDNQSRPSQAISALSRRSFLAAAGTSLADIALGRNARAVPADWTAPFPPHRIAANLFYVGSRDLAAFLITTPQGHILLNSNLASSRPMIRTAVETLGFHYRDIKILLISHGHYDHCAGSAQVLRETGAQYMVMDADVPVIEDGGHSDFRYGKDPTMWFPPAKVARVLHHGDHVTLGGSTLTAHKTAGHTRGCTTWTLEIQDDLAKAGPSTSAASPKSHHVVIVGSPNVNPGFNLIDDPLYPQMAADFTRTFTTLKQLPCEIFLGSHGGYYGLLQKYPRFQKGDRTAFLDPGGYQAYIADRQAAFEKELSRQRAQPSARKAL